MDFVVANSGTDSLGIFLGYGNISFTNPLIYSTGSSSTPYSVATGDFNNDTYMDIVVANFGSNNIGIFLGRGNGTFSNQTTYQTGTNPYSIVVDDFDNDFIPDIIVANYGSNNLVLFRRYRHGTFEEMTRIQLNYGSNPFAVFVADINNDKKLDFVVANNGTYTYQVFLQIC